MIRTAAETCPSCGRADDGESLVCALCGTVLRHAGVVAAPRAFEPEPRGRSATFLAPRSPVRTVSSESEPWIYLGIGAITAPLFAVTPLLGFMGWFLASLVHEMGHCAVAWFFGMPAFPAISLEGHAATVHSEPVLLFTLLVWAGLGGSAWRFLAGRVRWTALAIVAFLYPALAFTNAKECLHLLAGHGGELAFATLCLWKALDGGFTESRLERALYGTVGWYLVGTNVKLCLGLMFSASSREGYAENGSLGLTNDMIRAAEDVLHCRLQSVAFLMLLLSLSAVPAAMTLWRISSRWRAD